MIHQTNVCDFSSPPIAAALGLGSQYQGKDELAGTYAHTQCRVYSRWASLRGISASSSIGETATRSPAAVDFKISNNFGALLSGGESAIGFHPVTRHHLVGICDEAVERGPIPYQIGVLHGT